MGLARDVARVVALLRKGVGPAVSLWLAAAARAAFREATFSLDHSWYLQHTHAEPHADQLRVLQLVANIQEIECSWWCAHTRTRTWMGCACGEVCWCLTLHLDGVHLHVLT